MNKKAILLYFLLSAIVQVIFAQTQKGYVRTLERPDVPSVALEGVSILMHGEHNIVLSAADGLFHLSMHGKRNGDSYTLQWVKKYGYELADQGVIGRRYAYSDSVPLIVVMVSTEQLYADKQRIENNAYLTAERNYSNQIDILKQQLADSTISEENYRNKINELQHNLEYYQALIGDLADHYARTDYALLDENERNVNLYIEQGELERADSLLQMMFDPIGVLERNKEALAEAYRRLAEGKYLMEQALKYSAEVLYQQAKDAENLYRLYTIAIARFEYNKAKQYIEIRAALDSTNVEWQADAGLYCHNMADYNKAIDYYKNGLKYANDSSIWIALLYNNIGGIFSNHYGDFYQALEFHTMAMNILKSTLGEDNPRLAPVYNNIGCIYVKQGKISEALNYYFEALKISEDNNLGLSTIYNNIGDIYVNKHKYKKALEYYTMALNISQKELGENNPQTASIYNNIGNLYYLQKDNYKAIEYNTKALNIQKMTLGEEHPDVALSYYNIGEYYKAQGNYLNALKYHYKALEINKKLFRENNLDVAESYYSIGYIYIKQGEYSEAMKYLNKAYTIAKNIRGENDMKTIYYKQTIKYVKKQISKQLR